MNGMSQDQFKWYVVRAVTGQEKKVKAQIEIELERAGLSVHVPQILIPTEKVYTVKNGKKVAKEKAYLPGYILIQADAFFIGEKVRKRLGYIHFFYAPLFVNAKEKLAF